MVEDITLMKAGNMQSEIKLSTKFLVSANQKQGGEQEEKTSIILQICYCY